MVGSDIQGLRLSTRTFSLVRDLTNEDLPDPEGPISRMTKSFCDVDILLPLFGRRVQVGAGGTLARSSLGSEAQLMQRW